VVEQEEMAMLNFKHIWQITMHGSSCTRLVACQLTWNYHN